MSECQYVIGSRPKYYVPMLGRFGRVDVICGHDEYSHIYWCTTHLFKRKEAAGGKA